jgi:hypothetical protein
MTQAAEYGYVSYPYHTTFGLWNVRILYRAGSLMTVSRELAGYKLDLVGVQEVRWKGGGTEPKGE